MKKFKMKPDYYWYAAIIVLLIFGIHELSGMSMSENNVLYNLTLTPPANQIDTSINLMLKVAPTPICIGHSTTGTITSNMANGICSMFVNINNAGYQFYKNMVLDNAGFYSQTETINAAGIATFKAVCFKNDKYAISNAATLIVNLCPEDEEDNSEGGQSGVLCPAILFPTSQSSCDPGICYDSDYKCTYFPGTLATKAKCDCVFQCSDTDGGNVPLIKGTCKDKTQTITDSCSGTYLNENWCENNVCVGVSTPCGRGMKCQDGKCILDIESDFP